MTTQTTTAFTVYSIEKTYDNGRIITHDLSNGATIYDNCDGTAYDETNGDSYIAYSVGIGEPDKDGDYENYEFIGWVELSDFNHNNK